MAAALIVADTESRSGCCPTTRAAATKAFAAARAATTGSTVTRSDSHRVRNGSLTRGRAINSSIAARRNPADGAWTHSQHALSVGGSDRERALGGGGPAGRPPPGGVGGAAGRGAARGPGGVSWFWGGGPARVVAGVGGGGGGDVPPDPPPAPPPPPPPVWLLSASRI